MLSVVYRDWKYSYGRPRGEPYGEADARRRLETGKTMTVLFGSGVPSAPDVVLRAELGREMVVVTWLDSLQRPVRKCLWSSEDQPEPMRGRQLHLQQIHLMKYEHDDLLPEGEPAHDTAYYLETDGRYVLYRGRRGEAGERIEGCSLEQVQWEKSLVFGDWAPFVDREW